MPEKSWGGFRHQSLVVCPSFCRNARCPKNPGVASGIKVWSFVLLSAGTLDVRKILRKRPRRKRYKLNPATRTTMTTRATTTRKRPRRKRYKRGGGEVRRFWGCMVLPLDADLHAQLELELDQVQVQVQVQLLLLGLIIPNRTWTWSSSSSSSSSSSIIIIRDNNFENASSSFTF